ncbi:MAG: response regulator, partial [Campylobacterota bacterium]|nr:response regulator [Campylobacterota bacterium]
MDGLDTFKDKSDYFDVVITDIKMPKMDGIEMVREIKKINPNIFVIFITASRGSQKLDNNLSDIYIKKPLSYDDIVLIMEKIAEIKWMI